MLINKTNFTYLIIIIALVLTSCVAVQAAPSVSSTSAPTANPQVSASKASLATQTDQKCSNLPLSDAVVATLGNGTGLSTSLSAIDPATGKPICGYASIPLGADVVIRISPDRKYLATIDYNSGSGTSSIIQIVDLSNWRTSEVVYTITDWVPSMTFSPDSSHLALSFQTRHNNLTSHIQSYKVVMVDVRQSKVIAEAELGFFPQFLQFAPDGNQIIAVGGPQYIYQNGEDSSNSVLDARGIVMNILDLKSDAWEMPLQGILEGSLWTMNNNDPSGLEYRSAVQLSPDGRYIYIIHASEDKLTTVDLLEKHARTVAIQPKLSLLEQLLSLGASPVYAKELTSTSKEAVISPDDKFIYVLSLSMSPDPQNGFNLISHGIQVIETATSNEVGRLDSSATHMALSSNSQQLYLTEEGEKPWSEVVSTSDLKILAHLDGELLIPVLRQNGKETLMSSSQQRFSTKMILLDSQTLQPISTWLWNELTFGASPSIWPQN